MKRIISALLLFASLQVLFCCADNDGGAADDAAQSHDTLYTRKKAMDIYADQPERALQIVDSAEIVGNLSSFTASFLRARIYASTDDVHLLDTAMQICLPLLDHDSARTNPNCRYDILDQLRMIARQRDDNEQWLRWCTELANLCHEQGRHTDALRTEAEIGFILTRLGQRDEGLSRLDKSISRLDGQRRFSEMDAAIVARKRKINVLNEKERYSEVPGVAQRIIDQLDDYEAHPDDYADGSSREPENAEERVRYVGFYRAQAQGFMARAYALMGDYQQARRYLAVFEQSHYGQSFNGRKMAAVTWRELGEYDKMLSIYDEMVRRMGADTLSVEYAMTLEGRAVAAAARGAHAASQGYWHRYAEVIHAVNDSLHVSQAHDYAARYHAQEQQFEIERQKSEKSRLLLVAVILGLSLVGAIMFTIYFFRQRCNLKRKNLMLARQISEATEYREKYEELRKNHAATPVRQANESDGESVLSSSSAEPQPREADHSGMPDAMSDEELYDFLSEAIVRDKLYLSPFFGRQTLADAFQLSDHRIGAAFSQSKQHSSLPDFIRDCRLQHACRLFKSQPDMPISEVITASGFTNGSVFSRNFKTKYGITPTEYRNQLKDNPA